MNKNDIEKGLVKERKYLLPLNKIISNKKFLIATCVVMSICFILFCNYLFNLIFSIGNLVNSLGNLQTYFSLKRITQFKIIVI